MAIKRPLFWKSHNDLVRTENDLVASPEDEEVMILHLLNSPDLDLDAPLSIEWREYEPW